MALRAPDHYRDLTKFNLFYIKLFNQLPRLILTIPFSLLDVHIDFTVNLVSHVSDPCLVREVRIHGIRGVLHFWVFHHRLAASINLTKYYLVANIVVLMISLS